MKTKDACRILYVNAENGMNLRLFHEALKLLDPMRDQLPCVELALGEEGTPARGDGDNLGTAWADTVLFLLEKAERRVEELGLLKARQREETLALLGAVKRLVRLRVDRVVVGDLPLPPIARRNDARWALLSRFSGHESETTGVSATAALLLDVLGCEQRGSVEGKPVLASQIVGEEGTPFTLVLFETRAACGTEALGEGPAGPGADGFYETIVQFETNVDHMTGEEAGAALDALTADGRVLDALWLTGIGKKNRPTGLLRVLCHVRDKEEVLPLILRHTHTLGVREQEIRRFVAPRAKGEARLSDNSEVAAKLYPVDGTWHARPESDEVVRRARETGVGAPALRFMRVDKKSS